MRTEAAIVGAGPAGLLAAAEIAAQGFKTTVFEEHSTVGSPSHCAGLISVEGLERLGVEPSPGFVQHEIRGGRVYSPSGECIEVRSDRTRALAVDRAALDRHLAQQATDNGAEIVTGSRVESILLEGGHVGLKVSDCFVDSSVVVDAEGAGGRLLEEVGFPTRKGGFLTGLNAEVRDVEVEPHMVEVWFSRRLAPGLFAWVIPLGDGAARCGLASSGEGAHLNLGKFISDRFGDPDVSGIRGGVVLTGPPIGRSYGDGLLVAGDAAGQTKATTGGGVVTGGLCAIEAGRTAAAALEAGDISAGFLRRYEDSWRSMLGGEFRSMLAARRLLNRVSDERMDRLFRSFKEEGLEDILGGLVERGDMDMQSGVIREGLTDPRILGVLVRGLGRLALSELLSMFR